MKTDARARWNDRGWPFSFFCLLEPSLLPYKIQKMAAHAGPAIELHKSCVLPHGACHYIAHGCKGPARLALQRRRQLWKITWNSCPVRGSHEIHIQQMLSFKIQRIFVTQAMWNRIKFVSWCGCVHITTNRILRQPAAAYRFVLDFLQKASHFYCGIHLF